MDSPPTRRDEVVKAAFGYRDALISYAFAFVRDWPLAEDVVQNAYIIVMNQWEDVREPSGIFYWVRRIVHNKAMEAVRARTRLSSRPDDELEALVASSVEKYLDEPAAERQGLMRRALQVCMAELGPASLDLLNGFYARAQSCEMLAEAQKRSVNAIRLALSRLRKQLQACMSQRMPTLETEG